MTRIRTAAVPIGYLRIRPSGQHILDRADLSLASGFTGHVLASTFDTVIAAQRPPRAVGTPRAFRASAMARSDLAPARCISLMTGSTLAACRSAFASIALTAALRA